MNMRSEISMFLDDDYYDHETDASNIQKAKNWPIGLILYYRAASTYPRSIQKNCNTKIRSHLEVDPAHSKCQFRIIDWSVTARKFFTLEFGVYYL